MTNCRASHDHLCQRISNLEMLRVKLRYLEWNVLITVKIPYEILNFDIPSLRSFIGTIFPINAKSLVRKNQVDLLAAN